MQIYKKIKNNIKKKCGRLKTPHNNCLINQQNRLLSQISVQVFVWNHNIKCTL